MKRIETSVPTAPQTLTDRLREAIRQSGTSQAELARMASIDAAAMSRFISGLGGLSLAACRQARDGPRRRDSGRA